MCILFGNTKSPMHASGKVLPVKAVHCSKKLLMGVSEPLDPPTYKMTVSDLPKDSETVKELCSVQDIHLTPMHLVEPGPPISMPADACPSAGAHQPHGNPPPIIHCGKTSQSNSLAARVYPGDWATDHTGQMRRPGPHAPNRTTHPSARSDVSCRSRCASTTR